MKTTIKLVSSDLNGTLVHQHTMSDMIRLYVGQQQFEKANEVFKKQTSGTASMEEAFQNAGPLTKGLTLRQAIEYTKTHMIYVNGFKEFVNSLSKQKIPFVINSTGYSVTIYAIREQIGTEKIHGKIGNFLRFGMNGSESESLSERELESKVRDYFSNPESSRNTIYDSVQATGVIDLGIIDEQAKAKLIQEYVKANFKDIQTSEIVHMGDTMGDSGGIYGVAESGGIGIAFNYNLALQQFLEKKISENPSLKERILFVNAKSETSDLRQILSLLSI